MSQHLGGERDDLRVPLLAQLARDRPEDARPRGSPWSLMITTAFSSNLM